MKKSFYSFSDKRLTAIKSLVLFAFLIFGVIPTGIAQNLEFQHFGGNEGLSQNNVWDLQQDRLGFIWVATEDGLNVFDGYDFKIFRNDPADSFSISGNFIDCIAEDKNGEVWIGTQSGLNHYNRILNRFERFMNDPKDSFSISSNNIEDIFFDSKNTLWVATVNGLNHYDQETKKWQRFLHQPTDSNSIANYDIECVVEDGMGRIWAGTRGGLSVLNADGKGFTNFHTKENDPSSLSSNNIMCLYIDKEGFLWIGTFDGGLNKMDIEKKVFARYKHDPSNPSSLGNNYVYHLTENKNGELWVATDGALCFMDKKSGLFTRYISIQGNQTGLNSNTITKILFDRRNRMWVGTRYGGLNIYSKERQSFEHFEFNSFNKNSLSHNNVSGIEENKNGNFWIATDGGGLNHLNRKTGHFTHYIDVFSNNKLLAIAQDEKENLWVGMWAGGLNYFNPKTKKIKKYVHDPKNPRSLSDNNIFDILVAKDGTVWIATWGKGFNKYNPATDDFTNYVANPNDKNSFSGSSISFLMEDSRGRIFIATEQNGFDVLDPKTNTFTNYRVEPGLNKLSGNSVFCFFEDSKNRIWVGTNGAGLNLFHEESKSFTTFRKKDGLPNDAILAIQEDSKGELWISTNKGLCRFNPETNNFKNYTQSDGLQGDQFNRWASCKLKATGEFIFGGTNGFNLFRPENIKSNTYEPAVYITDFKIFNKPVLLGKDEPLEQNIILSKSIRLNHDENTFSFECTALNYTQPEKNQYRYKLEGFDTDWIDAGTERKKEYTNLSPGKYTFKVLASNNDGIWNLKGTEIKIVITPPFWNTWWFKTSIVIFLLGSFFLVITSRVNSIRKQKELLEEKVRKQTAEVMQQKEELEAQAENRETLNEQLQAQTDFLLTMNKELEEQKAEIILKREEAEKARHDAEKATQAKSVFLATMSHEIRTPMNGVLGMAALLAETTLTSEQEEYTDTIRNSGEALLTVINDILDFSKIESGKLELENEGFDLRQCLEEVLDLFAAKSAEKRLDLVYQIDFNIPAQITGDSHRLRQILINLVGNAIKFTQSGEVFIGIDLLKWEQDQLELVFHVRDTGIGIPKDKLQQLFKPFSQVDSSTTRKYGGTGLGLVISQRLIELMGGSITADSEAGVGTTFSFIIKSGLSKELIRQYVHVNPLGYEGKKALIVDDNSTNLRILNNQLQQWKFVTTITTGGDEALEILKQNNDFDLIITDMQMPDMDGVQLAKKIKAGHPDLPIILLSSVGDESKKKHPTLFSAVLNKPIRQQQLGKVIQQALNPGAQPAVTSQTSKNVLSINFAEENPITILIAEDNVINQKLAIRILNKLGYQDIGIAQNGLEAVQKLESTGYDVILMDIQMPQMDGLEATRMIRAKAGLQPIIISMTANAMLDDKEACILAGMDQYLSKPIKLEQLMSALQVASSSVKEKKNKLQYQ
jgi:signal transduction histidine kinase/CheY-like chemotaxis protein/ligand-binding sensor domain-containing protein